MPQRAFYSCFPPPTLPREKRPWAPVPADMDEDAFKDEVGTGG